MHVNYHEMTNKEVLASLPDGETVLWSSFTSSPPKELISPNTQKILSFMAYALALIFWVFILIRDFRRHGIADILQPQVLIIWALFSVLAIAIKYWTSRPWNKKFGANLYKNGILTAKRLIMYRHDRKLQLELSHDDILSVEPSFVNGSPSAAIRTASNASPIELIVNNSNQYVDRPAVETLRHHLKL